MSGCTWRVCKYATFRSAAQFRGKYEDLFRHLLSVLLGRRDADVRRSCDMTQIAGYLFIRCQGLLDSNVDRTRTCHNIERLIIK